MKKIYIFLISVLVLAGCISLGPVKQRDQIIAPNDIKEMAIKAKDNAKQCIESKGVKVREPFAVNIEKVKGEKNIYGFWCWKSPEWNGAWVTGLTYKRPNYYLIKVGANPKTEGDVKYSTLVHEFGHVFLMYNFNEYGHNIKYKNCFENWHDIKVKSFSILSTNEEVIVDYIEE